MTRVEFVPVLREKPQLCRDPFRDHRRQNRVDQRAGGDECDQGDRAIAEPGWKLDAHWWIVRSARDVTDPGLAGNPVIERRSDRSANALS